MRDVDIARTELKRQGHTLVIAKDSEVLFSTKDRGIKPMYTAVIELGARLQGASLADRVIGRAAAMLCSHVGIRELHTRLISESAIAVLEKAGITYTYDMCCPFIKNRDQTGMCPVENLSQGVDSPTLLLGKIEAFLESTKGGSR